MKYKIIGFICCFAVILIAVFAPLSYKDYRKTERIHQHEQEIPQEPCTDPADGGLCTYLPIVKIDTDGMEIPGRPIKDDGNNRIYTRATDGETTIAAQMDIIGNDSKEYHHANETADVSSAIRIRMRGNSSRKFDKPSYAIRLVDKKGKTIRFPLWEWMRTMNGYYTVPGSIKQPYEIICFTILPEK